ncbi:sugar kinase [Streptomyces sp. NPDC060194]|uniref:sugar kinase n=1 Tax=Streptomyces sp. NPDC060194 TaxID=3347069 RepID=UPI00364F6DB4
MTTTLSTEPATPDDERDTRRERRRTVRRRAITLLVILLLVGVPAGYLLISAEQSRDSGRDKESKVAVSGLTEGWPSKMQRRVFDLPIPIGGRSMDVAFYQTSNYRTSRLYVQFSTTPEGLDEFMTDAGTGVGTLKAGKVTISPADAKVVGWDFSGGGPWDGATFNQPDPQPTLTITVNEANPARPMVYVVSTTNP